MKNILFSLVALVSSASAPLAQCELQELLEAGGQAGDRFGYSVSLSGNLAVVGAPGADNPQADSGSARVFERGTTWVETAELAAAQPQANDNFGFSVAASGNRIIVGAPGTDGPGINAGAAYIFELQGPSWVQTARLTASNPLLRGRFGWIVDIEGETAVVGMHVEDPPVAQVVGSAYVFERTPSGWEETAILDSSNGQLEDHFGYALSLSGNRLLIGARANEAGGVQAGSAYVFERSGTAWVETATFFPAGIAEGNWFGEAVSLEGDRALIGANAAFFWPGPGAAYVYERVGASWNEVAKLTASNGVVGDQFGNSVSLAGNTAVIGAPRTDDLGSPPGSAYVSELIGQTWTQPVELQASNAAMSDSFGQFVSAEGDALLVGAPSTFAPLSSGSAYALAIGPAAQVAFRNSGANPASYSASAPVSGAMWSASVDLTTTGHTLAQILGFAQPATIPLAGNQVVLAGGPQVFKLPPKPGPIATWTALIPSDCSLVGRTVITQAVHFFGVAPFALSNAQDLTIGF